jgi:hypothetical protein
MGIIDPAEWAALDDDVRQFWTEWYIAGGNTMTGV